MTTPVRTRRKAPLRVWVAVAAVLAVLVLLVLRLIAANNPPVSAIPATPQAAAASFVEAYAAGDTPAACELASAGALTKMQAAGWCQTRPGWAASGVSLQSSCEIPPDDWFFVYRVAGDRVDGSSWVTVRVSGVADKWLVVGVGHTGSGQYGDPSPCGTA